MCSYLWVLTKITQQCSFKIYAVCYQSKSLITLLHSALLNLSLVFVCCVLAEWSKGFSLISSLGFYFYLPLKILIQYSGKYIILAFIINIINSPLNIGGAWWCASKERLLECQHHSVTLRGLTLCGSVAVVPKYFHFAIIPLNSCS